MYLQDQTVVIILWLKQLLGSIKLRIIKDRFKLINFILKTQITKNAHYKNRRKMNTIKIYEY